MIDYHRFNFVPEFGEAIKIDQSLDLMLQIFDVPHNLLCPALAAAAQHSENFTLHLANSGMSKRRKEEA